MTLAPTLPISTNQNAILHTKQPALPTQPSIYINYILPTTQQNRILIHATTKHKQNRKGVQASELYN